MASDIGTTLRVRDASRDDAEAIAAIYAHYVLTSLATFELDPPTPADMEGRRADTVARGLPFLVAEDDGVVIGFAYCGPYRARPAYAHTVEDSVYVAPGAVRRGAGRALLAELIARCEARGMRQMVAVIGNVANDSSIALHRALGFAQVGTLPAVGWKHGTWIGTVFMQRPLGRGGETPPGA